MNVSLTPELEEFVQQKVKTGRYSGASEVVREALRLLEQRDQLEAIKLTELRKEIRKGLDSGPATPFSADDLKQKLTARLDRKKKSKRRA